VLVRMSGNGKIPYMMGKLEIFRHPSKWVLVCHFEHSNYEYIFNYLAQLRIPLSLT